MSDPLIVKYRPNSFDEVIGQDAVVRSLQGICKRRDAQVFLFTGGSGLGKTTLSRIVCNQLGVENSAIMEIDAASRNGIDDMRQLQEIIQYRPFSGSGKRAVILDEFHACSKAAFDSLLKILEEPPEHVVWCFCTTNATKIPKTLQTRCAKFDLKLVSEKDLGELYDWVCEQEKIDLPGDVGDLIIKEAQGSPRQLLSNLVVARTAKTKKEAAGLLRAVEETKDSIELARFIMNGNGKWSDCMVLLTKLKDEQPESLRIMVFNYLAACLKNAKSDSDAIAILQKVESFANPYVGTEGIAPLLLSIGRALFSE